MSSTEPLRTARLTLTPLDVPDAVEMVGVLFDPTIYGFAGGEPPSFDQLEEQYRFQVAGSPRDGEIWHNWVIRLDGVAIGFVQATVTGEVAELAWVVGSSWQGRGYASEGSAAMRDWLAEQGVIHFSAHIHPDHLASNAVAARLGLNPTGLLDDEGESIWE